MSINKFKKKCGLNYQALSKIYLQKVSDITAMGAVASADPDAGSPVYHSVSTAPTFVVDSGFGQIPFSKNTGKYTAPLKGNFDAQSVDATITGIYPEVDAEAVSRVQLMLGCEVIVVAVFASGIKRQIGTLDNPCQVTKFDEDSAIGGYNVEIKWEGDAIPPICTYAIVEI